MKDAKKFRIDRAIFCFLPAYIFISATSLILSVVVAEILGVSLWAEVEIADNIAYNTAVKYVPFINILGWMAGAWLYFRKPTVAIAYKDGLKLGMLWFVLAFTADYVGFILIPHPFSLDANSFYIGQFPWIQIIYATVIFSPLLYLVLAKNRISN